MVPTTADFNPRTHRGVRRQTGITIPKGYNYFNPRTHRGVRLTDTGVAVTSVQFQSTHPSWGATVRALFSREWINPFQSTHPSWGATRYNTYHAVTWCNFNPRTHRGVRHASKVVDGTITDISIHAPIVGCDYSKSDWVDSLQNFNPRTHRGVRRS